MLTYYVESIYIINWIIFYSFANLLIKYYAINNNQAWLLKNIKEDDCPLYAFTGSVIHLGFWLPAILLYQMWYYNQLHIIERNEWIVENWHNKSEQFIEEQVLLSTIGYMIKDFLFCKMDSMMLLHHTICILMSFLVLNIADHNNIVLIIMSICTLEIGTLTRNIYACFPNYKTLNIYILTMQYSNIKTMYWLVYNSKKTDLLIIEYFTFISSFLLILKRFQICNNILIKSLKRYIY